MFLPVDRILSIYKDIRYNSLLHTSVGIPYTLRKSHKYENSQHKQHKQSRKREKKKKKKKRKKRKKRQKRQKDKKTKKVKRQKDKKQTTKRQQKDKKEQTKRQKDRRQKLKIEFNTVTSGQFCTLAMFDLPFYRYIAFYCNCQRK